MFCAQCGEKINGKAIRQGSEYYCSLECANLSSGLEADETEEYFEEDSLEEYFTEEE